MGALIGRARQATQAALRSRGRELSAYPHPESYVYTLRKTLDRLGIRLVIDVGAHQGEAVRLLRDQVGYTGPVTSFECAPRALAALRPLVAADPSWELVETALGDQAGEATFTEYDISMLSSLHAPSEFASADWNFDAGTRITVPVQRLDAVMPEGDPVLLKIDTQGHDLAVLRGAAGVLDRVVAIQMEMSVIPLYEQTASLADHIGVLAGLGFDPVGFWPVATKNFGGKSQDDLRVVEFDCLLIRSD